MPFSWKVSGRASGIGRLEGARESGEVQLELWDDEDEEMEVLT